jgi:multiple sugar transport system permease protein
LSQSVEVVASAKGATTGPTRRKRKSRRGISPGAFFAAPFALLFLIVFVAPVIYSIFQSLLRVTSSGLGLDGSQTNFVGLYNYVKVATDPVFWAGVGRVFEIGAIQVPVMLLTALLLALLLDSAGARGVAFFRLSHFLPFAIPGVVAAMLWSYLYTPQLSPIVQGARALGVPLDFLSPGSLPFAIINITTWTSVGFNMLILLAALKAIPTELFDAARVDGATEIQIAIHVKIPAVRGALVLTGLLSIIGCVQLFTEPTVLQNISNYVSNEYTPTMYSFYQAFTSNNYNFASAASILLALIAGILSIIYFRATKKVDEQ